jgi:hypothetical protein
MYLPIFVRHAILVVVIVLANGSSGTIRVRGEDRCIDLLLGTSIALGGATIVHAIIFVYNVLLPPVIPRVS